MRPPNRKIQYLNNNHCGWYIRYLNDDNIHIGYKIHKTSHEFTIIKQIEMIFSQNWDDSGHNIFLHNADDASNNKM